MSNPNCPDCCKKLERETEPSVLEYCAKHGIEAPLFCEQCGKVFREKTVMLSTAKQAEERGVDLNNVIAMGRSLLPGEKQETWQLHWEHLARENPEWAARQIDGLLKRALAAEAELEKCNAR